MIYGELEQFKGNFTNCEAIRKAVRFVLDVAPGLPDGKHDIADGMFAELKHYSPAPAEERRYETHIKYVDLQVVFSGSEIVYCRPLEKGMAVAEDKLAENDVRFHVEPAPGPEVGLRLRPGLFLILFPADAHKTECCDGVETCRKAIVKIPAELVTSAF